MTPRETLEQAMELIRSVNPSPPDDEASDMWDAIVGSIEVDVGDLLMLLDVWEVLEAGRRSIRHAVSDDGRTLIMYLDSAGRATEIKELKEEEEDPCSE